MCLLTLQDFCICCFDLLIIIHINPFFSHFQKFSSVCRISAKLLLFFFRNFHTCGSLISNNFYSKYISQVSWSRRVKYLTGFFYPCRIPCHNCRTAIFYKFPHRVFLLVIHYNFTRNNQNLILFCHLMQIYNIIIQVSLFQNPMRDGKVVAVWHSILHFCIRSHKLTVITVRNSNLWLRQIWKSVFFQLPKIRCNPLVFPIIFIRSSIMIQHTGQILFFAIQHASPGPSQHHLHPMQQTPERIHSVHPHCRMMNPETTCHKFNAPHWFSSFSNPFHVPGTRFPEFHTLPVSIARIKTDARIVNKSRCCLQIIKSKRLIFCKMVRCMSLSRRILFYRFCQFCNKICDTIGKEAPHIQPCLRCPDFVFIYLHCNVFER